MDLEAEAEGAGSARAPAVRAPTERVDRDGLRREAGVAAPVTGSKEQMAMDGSAPAAWQVDLDHRDGDEGEVIWPLAVVVSISSGRVF